MSALLNTLSRHFVSPSLGSPSLTPEPQNLFQHLPTWIFIRNKHTRISHPRLFKMAHCDPWGPPPAVVPPPLPDRPFEAVAVPLFPRYSRALHNPQKLPAGSSQ